MRSRFLALSTAVSRIRMNYLGQGGTARTFTQLFTPSTPSLHPARLVSRCQVLLRSREDYQKTVFGVFSQLVFGVPVSGRPLKIGFRIFVHCIFMQTSTHPVSGRPLKIGSQIFSPAGLRCPGLPKNPKFPISNFRHSLDWSETKRAGCSQKVGQKK